MSITFSGNGSGGGIRMSGGGGGGNVINGVTVSGTPTSGQVLTATSSTAASWATPSGGGGARLPIDANHVDVWYLDETDGATFANQVSGRPNLVGGSDLVVLPGYCYKSTKSAVWTNSSSKYLIVSASSYDFDKSTSITVELVTKISNATASNGFAWDYYTPTWYTSSSTDFFSMRTRDNGSNTTAYAYYANGGSQNTTHFRSYGILDGFDPGIPHHVMQVWDLSTSQVISYVDGWPIGSSSSMYARQNNFNNFSLVFWQGFSYADVRVSNIARSASYAQAATRAMFSL